MSISVCSSEWKAKESSGKRSQSEMGFIAEVAMPQIVPAAVVAQATFNGCLVEAARHSGMEDQEIADKIHISHGYMSKFMRGVCQQWAKRLINFMRVTQSIAPLQWMAEQMGCDLVVRANRAAEIAALKAQLMEMERGSRACA